MTKLHSMIDANQFWVGFDKTFGDIEKALSQSKYPPHDIVKVKDNQYQIILAVAGFTRNDIEISLDDNKLIIVGNKPDKLSDTSVYVYNGISNRSFKRTFTLRENVNVRSASVSDGLLTITLDEIIPEAHKPLSIAIT